ncbi:MAG: hypothetical protein H0U42_01385 [Thermoleophilaceae bacterium]|nr:hypothetical protein [Thermoleophilaceae bacterium]
MVQTNLAVSTVSVVSAVAIATATAVVTAPPGPTGSSAQPEATAAPITTALSAVETAVAVAFVGLQLGAGDVVGAGEPELALGDLADLLRSPILLRGTVLTGSGNLPAGTSGPERPVRQGPRPIPSPTARELLTGSVWTQPLSPPRRDLPGAASQPAADSAHAPRAFAPPPAPLPSLPERVPVAALGLGGAAPGTSGDGGFLLLLLIPFAFAFADAARRVTRQAPAVAAQVESSRRERPG